MLRIPWFRWKDLYLNRLKMVKIFIKGESGKHLLFNYCFNVSELFLTMLICKIKYEGATLFPTRIRFNAPIISYHPFHFLFSLVFNRADKIKKLAIFFAFAKLTS